MKRRWLGCVLLLLALLGSKWLIAQSAAASRVVSDVIAGRVVSARDGHPLPGARVTLTASGTDKLLASALSGDDGSFRFEAVPTGKWALYGADEGYVSAGYLGHGELSTAIVTGAGLSTGALLLSLTPAGRIEGTIRDESGEGVPSATVSLFRERPPGSEQPVRMVRAMQTDAQGRFEFADVVPGRFYLAVHATPWYAVNPVTDEQSGSVSYRVAVAPELQVAYPTTFYPDAHTSAEASPLDVHAGERVTADMQLTPERALALVVRSPDFAMQAGHVAAVQLVENDFGVQEPVPGQMQVVDGRMQMVGVAPGQYELRLSESNSPFPGGSQQIHLTGESTNIEAEALPSSVPVTLHVHASAGSGTAVQLQAELRQAANGPQVTEPVDGKGEVTFSNVPPGDYVLSFLAQDRMRTVRGIQVDGHTTASSHLHVSGSEPVMAEVELSGKPERVEGFATRAGAPAVATMVVLIPAGADTNPELFRRDQSDLDGSFSLTDVPPGNYVLVAIDDGWPLRWTDTATMLRYLPHGVPVVVPESGGEVLRLPHPVTAQPR